MRRILLGSAFVIVLTAQPFVPAWAKTLRECNAAFAADKAAGRATQTKADFVAACRGVAAAPPGVGSSGPPSAKAVPDNGLRKATAAETAMDRKLKHDMNICIGC